MTAHTTDTPSINGISRRGSDFSTRTGRTRAVSATSVAVLSGLCEEALLRGLVQEWVGLVPAAAWA